MSSVYPMVDAEPVPVEVEPDVPVAELSGRTTDGAVGVGPSPQPLATTASQSPMNHEIFRMVTLSASKDTEGPNAKYSAKRVPNLADGFLHLAVAGEVRNTIAVWPVRNGSAA